MIIGLVGKPSSGKSSFFKAATLRDVEISEVPFTTIEPNVGVGYVSIECVEEEFGVRCNPRSGFCKKGRRFIPVKLIDVGGLIPGSHKGRGIGNKFLDDLRQASVLIQLIDTSGLTDEEGKPTQNFDPEREIRFLEEEIDFWFEDIVRRALSRIKSSEKDPISVLVQQFSGLGAKKEDIERVLQKASLSNIKQFARELRRIVKPILIAANKIDLKEAQKNFEVLRRKYENMVPVSAEAEIALKKASEKGLIDYLPGNGFEVKDELTEEQKRGLEFIRKEVIEKYGSTGVQECLNTAVFRLADHIPVYPVADAKKLTDTEGNVLPDVFLIPKGTTLKEFAFKIHSDMGERFICGIDARTGKKLPGDYVLKERDVVEIRFRR